MKMTQIISNSSQINLAASLKKILFQNIINKAFAMYLFFNFFLLADYIIFFVVPHL